MKVLASILGSLSIFSSAGAQTPATATKTDWSQPPLACLERILPSAPTRPCPDLSRIAEITKELKGFSRTDEEEVFWLAPENRKALNYCRSVEILRREKAKPGSMTPAVLQVSWMRMTAVQNAEEKLAAVLNANAKYGIPAFVLAGALTQESLFSDLGITDDGGNFSCGVGQINVLEWCRWARGQSKETQARLGWPADVRCESLSTESMRPFHQIAMRNLQGQPHYRLNKDHFARIALRDVQDKIPGTNLQQKRRHFSAIQSFISNCGKPLYGIDAKAHELTSLFRVHVPAGLKSREVYAAGQGFQQPHCRYRDHSRFYPLHTGWLLAVAAYNAGPRATEVVPYFYGLSRAEMQSGAKVAFLTPNRLIEGLFGGGQLNSVTGRVEFVTLSGSKSSNPAFKQCVMHQHVVRIVQHVTRSGEAPLLQTLNETGSCSQESPLPMSRQKSSGRFERGRI